MAGRAHTSNLISARADCQRCTFTAEGKNAQALAAQHHDKKNHLIKVTTTTEITYGRSSARTATDSQKSML